MVATASVNAASASNVLDFDLNTEWATGSVCSSGGGLAFPCCEPAWLEVQFAMPQSVRAVAIRNRVTGNREFSTGRLEFMSLNGGLSSVDIRLTPDGEWAGAVLAPAQVSAVRFRAGFATSMNGAMTEFQFFQ